MIKSFRITIEPWFPSREDTLILKYKVEKFGEEDLFYQRAITLDMLEQEGWFDLMLREAGTQLKRHLIESKG